MAYISKEQNNYKNLNLAEDKEETENNTMLIVMNNLISTMQQLQKVILDQIPHNITKEKNTNIEKNLPSQTEILLQQIQSAMEATIAQMSNRDKTKNNTETNITDITQMAAAVELSISQKWRLYTEMFQQKNEPAKEYCLNKMKLGQELGLSFKETKREMLVGLWSNRLPIILFLKQHETEEDILNDIEDWERLENSRFDVFKKCRNKK